MYVQYDLVEGTTERSIIYIKWQKPLIPENERERERERERGLWFFLLH